MAAPREMGKMTISQFEQGKNSPTQGELLLKLISALSLSSERFTNNIDKHGKGTAEYACECIKKYLA